MVVRRAPFLLIAVIFAGCRPAPSAISPAPTYAASPVPVAQSAPAASAPESHKGLPDPTITPGERTPQSHKAAKLDPETVKSVISAYGAKPGDIRTEVVRLIPAELGGTDGLKNLFLTTPWFADLKSRLDKQLVDLVKSGQITVDQAETDLTSNWVRATHKHYVRNYGAGDKEDARKIEDSNRW